MSSKAIFKMANKYAIERVIRELEQVWEADNADLSVTILRRINELKKELCEAQ